METSFGLGITMARAHGYDAGQAIAVDADGNAYVTGNHTIATGLECVTLKYSAAGDLFGPLHLMVPTRAAVC